MTIDNFEQANEPIIGNIVKKVNNQPAKDVFFSLSVSLSNTMYIHERKSGTVLNVLGDIGGFNDAILLLFGPLILYYSSF